MTRAMIGSTPTRFAALTVIAAVAWARPALAQDQGQAPPAEGYPAQEAAPPPPPAEAPPPPPPPPVRQVAPPPETVSEAS